MPEGEEGEVRAFRCPEDQAKQIQAKVRAFVSSVENGTAPERPGSLRQKVVYSSQNSQLRSVTFGFSDPNRQRFEYGKVWYGHGWLFHFRTAAPLKMEYFPPRYLMEVGKRATAPKKEAKKE
jgi:hypothetical protein